MDRSAWIGLGVGVLVILGIAGYYHFAQRGGPELPAEPAFEAPLAAPDEAPAPDSLPETPRPAEPPPAIEPEPAPALPRLEDSDAELAPALRGLLPARLGGQLLTQRLIERMVVVVDNLDGQSAPLRQWPIRHIPNVPVIEADGERYRWHPANADRYRPYVDALARADAAQLVALYRQYQPLFEQAYTGLGYPDGDFDERLIAIIDHLLAAPSVTAPIPLVQPKVLYRYADPRLESLSWGHKQMIRIGPEHAATVKAALRRIRAELAGG